MIQSDFPQPENPDYLRADDRGDSIQPNLANSDTKISKFSHLIKDPTLNENEDFYQEVECQAAELSELLECKDVKIELGEPEIVQGGFLSGDYTMYPVHTSPMGWSVKRRYSDFAWLFDCIKAHFPFHYLPSMPDKTMTGKNSDLTILKRFGNFKEFLNILAAEEDFKSCAELKSFLQLQDSPFENYKKTFGNPKPSIIPPSKIGSFSEKNIKSYDISKIVSPSPPKKKKNATGHIELSIGKKNHQYIKEVKKLAFDSFPIFDEALLIIKDIEELWCKVGTAYGALASCFTKLSNCYKEVNTSLGKEHDLGMETSLFLKNFKAYHKSAEIFKKLGSNYQDQGTDTFTTLNRMLDYSKKETESVQDLFTKWTTYTSQYKNRQEGLQKKKEDLWNKGETKKWEIGEMPEGVNWRELSTNPELAYSLMLPTESRVVEYLRDVWGHCEAQLVSQSAKF
jgi:hypothetical protein